MKAGVVLDDWKLPIFERHLKAAEIQFEVKGNFTEHTVVLTIEAPDAKQMMRIAQVIREANTEAAIKKQSISVHPPGRGGEF